MPINALGTLPVILRIAGPISFEAPGWLWLLAPCAVAIWAVTLAWPVARRGARVAPAVALTVASGLAILALARPVRVTETRAVSAVALIDVSASVSDRQLARARALVERLARAAVPPHELRVVRFAAEPVAIGAIGEPAASAGVAALPANAASTAPDRFADPGGLDTDIARALALGAGLGDPARTRRVLLVSDGRPTRGDTLAQAGRLTELGIPVDHVALDDARAGDVAIASLSAPADVHPHEEVSLQIRIAADRPAQVKLSLKRDGRVVPATAVTVAATTSAAATSAAATAVTTHARPSDDSVTLAVARGETAVSWSTRVDGPEPAIFIAELFRTDGADAHPENDRGLLAVAPLLPPRALVLAPAAADVSALVEALRAQSIDVDVRAPPPRGLAAADLARADLVVLADLPRAALSDASLAALAASVRDGGGLLVTGGPHAFGPGGWAGSRLEPLLPVRLDAPERRDEPTLALALVIDRSGSMAGARMDLTKQAARATADMLPPGDQIAVIAFDTQATTIVPLQRASNRLRIATDIGRIQPTGGTNILAGLREAVDQLADTRARTKHAILLSDGQSATDGIAELVDAAAGSHITISTVGVGEGVDEALMQMIASHGGGRAYHARDPASIPRIFSRETSEVAATGIVERAVSALPRKHAPMLDGIPFAHAPALEGFVRTHARPEADLFLATGDGDPLLARWSVGLGQVAAWTSDLGPRWAAGWARWPPFAKLWSQVARTTMRARAAERFPLLARLDQGVVSASVEAVGADDRFLAGLDGVLEISEVAADGAMAPGPPRRVAMPELAPGHYEARFPGSSTATGRAPGALLLHAALSRDGRPVAAADAGLALPFAPELSPIDAASAATGGAPSGTALLATLSARTGGHALASPEELFRDAPPRRSSTPLRTPLLIAAAALVILEVALRRLAGASRAPRSSRTRVSTSRQRR